MATKDEMEKDILEIFDNNELAFREIKLDRLDFIKWFCKFQTHAQMRKVNAYMQKLIVPALAVRDCLNYFPYKSWALLKQFSKKQKEVMLLKDLSDDLKAVWVKRPKAPRKGSS